MDSKTERRTLRVLLYCILSAAIALIFLKYILPCTLPFILASLTAWLAEPTVVLISEKLKIGRGAASFFCMAVFVMSILGVTVFILSRIIYSASDLLHELPQILSSLSDLVKSLTAFSEKYITSAPEEIRDYLESAIAGASSSISELPVKLSNLAIGKMTSIMSSTSSAVVFIAMYIVSSFFISWTFPDIKFFITRQVPPRLRAFTVNLKRDILDGMGTWFKAQLTLMCMTFLELSAAFTIMKIKDSLLIAGITAIIDALPVLGTGIVLIPWALFSLLTGSTAKAIGLIVTYGIVTMLRSFLEPKIVSAGFGVNPAAALLAAYTGLRLCGVGGMVLFPLCLMLIKSLNDKGYIRLWK